jgi:predicted Zn-dependent protease
MIQLVEMNVTWQQSHQLQDQRIAELEEQIRQMSLHRGTGGLDEQQQAEIDRLLLDQKNKYRQLEDEKLLVSCMRLLRKFAVTCQSFDNSSLSLLNLTCTGMTCL